FKAYAEEGEGEPEALGATYKVGDIIKFGHYEQDGNTANGKEEIEWQVLKVESDRVLVISKYCLDCKLYNTEDTGVTWENCTLRKWLNNDFKNAAFTSAEQAKIPTVNLVNKNNPKWGTAGGNNTNDQIFCLSLEEMESYFGKYSWYNSEFMCGYNQNLICDATQYAINNGADTYTITADDYNFKLKDYGYTSDVIGRRGAWWWLRSPGLGSRAACRVGFDGDAGANYGSFVYDDDRAVRPALFLNLNPNPQSINLNKTSATIYYGGSLTLKASITPADADKTVTWSSSNPTVASVSGGVVKTKGAAGKTTITAKTVNGLTATCEVTVFADNNPSNIFADIKYGSWQYNAAKPVYEKGYMTGKGDLSGRVLFSPDTNINRSQFVVALYSMDGSPAVTYKQKFSDVKSSAWYANQVTWASDNGIVAGNADGTFGVNGKATREQLALMFYKYAVYKNYNVSVSASTTLDGFTDAGKVDSWALTAMKWAVERGIISGQGNATAGYHLDPTKGATRAECAAMMNKFDEIYSGALTVVEGDIEEPIALPLEETEEDIPIPPDETEENIEDGDVESPDENEGEDINTSD
ncbi:MAG: S-layer homology domain-containing protein, partial [Lachnospiraceae bacterium]|nr:S-layer homology domain-containing protein [Lachnospiraceae bacterium]